MSVCRDLPGSLEETKDEQGCIKARNMGQGWKRRVSQCWLPQRGFEGGKGAAVGRDGQPATGGWGAGAATV